MIRTHAIVFALILTPVAALAQDGLGLDLTAPDQSEQPAQEEAAAAQEEAPAAGTLPPEDRKAPTKESLLEGERDVTVEDRVRSVQKKLYLKKGRFELSPFISYAVNDPYYTKWGAELRGAYYLQDTLAVGARLLWMNVFPNDDVRTAKRTFQSRIFYSVPQYGGIANVEWSPIYGKFAAFNDILHFDSYVIGGAGVIITETSSAADRGPNPTGALGAGVRFVWRDYLAVTSELLNFSYVDAPAGTTKGSIQNMMMLNAGVSVFFPFKSTNQEAQ